MAKLTVIVPVYSAEKYLHKCVDSILGQDYKDIEVLLIDDGSPDNCPAICDEYVQKDSRVRVIHQANQGIALTRNIGVREANTEYVSFIDSDDFILPGMFSKMISIMEERKNIDITICDVNLFYDDERKLVRKHQNIDNNLPLKKLQEKFLLDEYPNYLANTIYRRNIMSDFNIPEGTLMEDLYSQAELMAKARGIYYVADGFYCYRQHISTFEKQSKVKKKFGMFMAWSEHERVCEKYGFDALRYSKIRAQKAAISLKLINYADPYLNDKQIVFLNKYLSKIKNNKNLSLKFKIELWALNHLPISVCRYFGYLSILGQKLKTH